MNTLIKENKNDSRNRILLVALELFANEGFSKTSTRHIAEKANVNLSAIKYYFGDKHGLYEAAFKEPMALRKRPDFNSIENNSIENILKEIFFGIIEPLKQSENMKLCMKLHMREMLEPTGFWDNEIENEIKPHHTALVNLLKREFGKNVDEERIHRLAFSVMGLGIFLHVGQDVIGKVRPSLIDNTDSLNQWAIRLVEYAKAIIEAEKKFNE